MAVQYDKEKGFTTWIDLFKEKIADVSTEINNLFANTINKLSDNDLNKIFSKNNGIETFIEKNKIADESFKEWTSTVRKEEFTFENYQQWMIENDKATSTFATFTQKAGSVLKGFGAALGSTAINWAIGEAIKEHRKKATKL